MAEGIEPTAQNPPARVRVEPRLDGIQVQLPTAERNRLVSAMQVFINSSRLISFFSSLILGPCLFTLIERSALSTLYGGVDMASKMIGLCIFLTALGFWLLHSQAENLMGYLLQRLSPTELIIAPHELRLKRGIRPVKKLPSVSLRGVRRAVDGRSVEVFLADGSVVAIGRGHSTEILEWLEGQLREHISNLRTRQGAANEVPRALRELRQ